MSYEPITTPPQASNLKPRIAFITVGDPNRLTGGYLYHARVFAILRSKGVLIDQIVACDAPLADQIAAAGRFGATFDPHAYDAIVIDALGRGVCAPSVDRWRAVRPVVVLVHQLPSIAEADADEIARERALEQPLLNADRLIAVSAHGRQVLIDRGVSSDRIVIASPGFDRLAVDDGRWTMDDDRLRHNPQSPTPNLQSPIPDPQSPILNPQSHTLRVLCVAQWIPRKGIATLIEAWTQLQLNATLDLIGETDADPAYTAQIRRLIDAAPVGSINVRGVVDDAALQHAYRSADLFVLPSRFEGYGMVYAEALAHGLPIVACRVGPVPDLIGGAGVLVPPDDALALATALDQIMSDHVVRGQLATNARHQAATLPRWIDAADAVRGAVVAAIGERS